MPRRKTTSRMSDRPTMRDVARRSGTSVAAVSRVLNGGVVSDAYRDRIEAAIRDLGYRRNDMARGLVTGRSGLIGVALPDLVGPLYAQMARGVEDVLETRGMHAMVVSDQRDPNAERDAIELLRGRQVDALILIGTRLGDAELRDAAGDVPVVLVQADRPDGERPQVRLDDAAGMRAAFAHLHALGHRRIAHLSGARRDGAERRAAFEACAAEAGLEVAPVVPGDSTEAGGERAAEEVARHLATAVACANDRSAVGLIHGLRARGLRVPDDVSVVGYDDLDWTRYLSPPLTTVRQPGRWMGREAARLALADPDASERSHVRVAPELIVRGSTRAPASAPATASTPPSTPPGPIP